MRLCARDRNAIRRAAAEVAGPDARVFLFVQRPIGERKIDLLVADRN
jgi:hypothetical protein